MIAPGIKIAAGITVGFVVIAGFVVALSLFASKQRQETAETALVQDHVETVRINREIGRQAQTHDNDVAAAKSAAYEQMPEIQLLRALQAEGRRELAKREATPAPTRSGTQNR